MPAYPALIPLVTTTASLSYAVAELAFVSPLVRAKTISPESISGFWDYALVPGVIPVIAFNGTSTLVGTMLWRQLAEGSFGRSLVGWGTVAAAAHFAYGYKIAYIIKSIVYKPATARDSVRSWLKWHAIRTLTTDIPAFLCFFAAVYHGV
ncbi:hypothetical protein GYMLUDRAFT_74625 [Collybiopsis luxurians FD-317 M1]|uniref:Unplaced genomic scaffold GYMLUscaffold_33, whole genome shotgun sequence n=1 Tax=Collybiopsis luxurians FD-317 M1 TaxID=944289 RepID=A0A0D0B6M7_9AGAR|nr:hypothetical protein GYMLUDRAFT_74625 [Collybiopsis luxurians FD-317 M1]